MFLMMINTLRKRLYLKTSNAMGGWEGGLGGPASSTTTEIYVETHEHTAISTALQPPKVCGRFFYDVYSVLKRIHLGNFSITSTIFIKI